MANRLEAIERLCNLCSHVADETENIFDCFCPENTPHSDRRLSDHEYSATYEDWVIEFIEEAVFEKLATFCKCGNKKKVDEEICVACQIKSAGRSV